GDLAGDETTAKAFEQAAPDDVSVTAVAEWKVLGTPLARPNRRDVVAGGHRYPSVIRRNGMLLGKVLRPPSFGAKLLSVDLAPAKVMPELLAVRDGPFVGVVASKIFLAERALAAVPQTAKWEQTEQPSSRELFEHLDHHARDDGPLNPFVEELGQAD